LIIIFVALLTTIVAVPPSAAQVPPGGYLQTCSNIQFDGYTLSAVCQGPGGQGYPARLAGAGNCRGDIANISGQLACVGGGGAPQPQYGGQYGGPPPQYGYPPPRRDYGGPRPYGRDYGGGDDDGGGFGLPRGSWRLTCGNPVMRGPVLFAECQRGDGGIQPTRADVRSCRRFANFNGQLACE